MLPDRVHRGAMDLLSMMPRELAQALPFIHPALAWLGLAAGAVPLIIHLLNRRRYRRVPWAAMRFLQAAQQRSRRRLRLEHWLLLSVRVAAMLFFGWAIARPYLPATAFVPLAGSRTHRVIVIDNSLSMQASTTEDKTRLAQIRTYARQLQARFPEGDAVSVVTMATPATALVGYAAHDARFVREQLGAIEPSFQTTDVAGAMFRAQEILRETEISPENRAVYIFSDFARRDWVASALPGAPPSEAVAAVRALADDLSDSGRDLTLVQVATGPLDNVAVTNVTCASNLVGSGMPIRIETEVTNYGSTTVRDAVLHTRRDGQAVRRDPLPSIAPGQTVRTTLTTVLPLAGGHMIEASVQPSKSDVLRVDNTRLLAIESSDMITALLVDGRPGATTLAGQAGYLATALSPRTTSDEWSVDAESVATSPPLLETKTIGVADLDAEALPSFDVVALCDVAFIPPEQWDRLRRYVVAGGGLLIVLGAHVQPNHYNQYGFADGEGVLPGLLRSAPAPSPPVEGGLQFDATTLTHPIVAPFSRSSASGLFLTRIDQYLPLDPDPRFGEVILRYTNGDAALAARAIGKGRVLVFTSTATMEWNNLPAKGDFVSLVLQMFAYLSPPKGMHRNLMVGEWLREPMSPSESALPVALTDEQGSLGEGRLVPANGTLALQWGPAGRPGVVTLTVGTRNLPVAVNVDPVESDLLPVDMDALRKTIDRPVRVIVDPTQLEQESEQQRAGELAGPFLLTVVFLLLIETALAMWFGSGRAAAPRRSTPIQQELAA